MGDKALEHREKKRGRKCNMTLPCAADPHPTASSRSENSAQEALTRAGRSPSPGTALVGLGLLPPGHEETPLLLHRGHRQGPLPPALGSRGSPGVRQPAPVRTASFLGVLAQDHLGGTLQAPSPMPGAVLPTGGRGAERRHQAPLGPSKLRGRGAGGPLLFPPQLTGRRGGGEKQKEGERFPG